MDGWILSDSMGPLKSTQSGTLRIFNALIWIGFWDTSSLHLLSMLIFPGILFFLYSCIYMRYLHIPFGGYCTHLLCLRFCAFNQSSLQSLQIYVKCVHAAGQPGFPGYALLRNLSECSEVGRHCHCGLNPLCMSSVVCVNSPLAYLGLPHFYKSCFTFACQELITQEILSGRDEKKRKPKGMRKVSDLLQTV